MDIEVKQRKRRDNIISSLNLAIDALNLAGGIVDIVPAKAVFDPVSVLLTMIRDSKINQGDSVELGLACANVCIALYGGLKGKRLSDLSQSLLEAIGQLTTVVTEIQQEVVKQGKQGTLPQLFHSKHDKEKIATWRADLNRILLVFNTELAIDTHITVTKTHALVSDVHHDVENVHVIVANIQAVISDMRQEMQKREKGADDQNRMTQNRSAI